MYERASGPIGTRRSIWSVLILAICLTVSPLLSACNSEREPASASAPPEALATTVTHTLATASTSTKEARLITPTEWDNLRPVNERASEAATKTELGDLVSGNSAFAFDLYRTLAARDGNLFYSPYSISLAIGMTYAGARGETERQMADTLRILLPQDTLHSTFNALDREIASGGKSPRLGEEEAFRLNIANAVWGQEDHGFLEEFLNILSESYGAGVRPVDFRGSPEESRVTINDWVAESTEGRITDLLPPDIINEMTRMVLTNAIYFNARWQHAFEDRRTRPEAFHLLDGSSIDVPMMNTTDEFGYARGEGYQVVDLPYVGGELSMTLMLPDRGRFREFEGRLDAAFVGRIIEGIKERQVDLKMPRFEFESQFRLSETLKRMGMVNPFDPATAEFSGMDGKSCLAGDVLCLFIRDIVHKAFVSVDEEGTEAAAATGVVSQLTSVKPEPIEVTVDMPFIFLIRDQGTGAILFVGRVQEI